MIYLRLAKQPNILRCTHQQLLASSNEFIVMPFHVLGELKNTTTALSVRVVQNDLTVMSQR